MSKKKKKKSFIYSRFYQVYIAVVLIILLAMCVGRVWLNGVLVDYEASRPVYVAEEVAKLFEDGDYETIYRLDTSAAELSGGDEAFYLDSLRAVSAGKDVEWEESFSSNPDERRYTVTLDGGKFASFTLVPSGQTTGHGNTLWQLGSVSTLVQLDGELPQAQQDAAEPAATPEPTPVPVRTDCVIRVPNGYSVTVDGTALSIDNATVTAKSIMPDNFLPESVTGLTYTEYAYTAATEAPEVVVTDAAGAAQQAAQNGVTWTCPTPGNAEFQQRYGGAVQSLAQRIAKVTARDASVGSVTKYCAKGSPARQIFDNYSNRWATPHSRTEFRNFVISEFYAHSDVCFTCHVTFDFVLFTKNGEQVYPTAYTFCVVNQGGSGKLYNLMMQ